MANREKGEWAVTIGGKEYTLRMTLNAECEVEAALSTGDTRVTYGQVLGWVAAGDRRAVRAFLWGALREYHGREVPTLEAAGRLITEAGGVRVLTQGMADAVTASQADPADLQALEADRGGEAPPADPPKGQAGTGPRSIGRAAGRA